MKDSRGTLRDMLRDSLTISSEDRPQVKPADAEMLWWLR